MNYSADTEADLNWAADQLRRAQNLGCGLPDQPVRRLTSSLRQGGALCPDDPAVTADTTIGNALSGLAIHAHSGDQCRRICESILVLLSDQDRIALHTEFARLKGVEMVVGVAKQHSGETALAALRILEKLSRTSSRAICGCGGVDVVIARCGEEDQLPSVVESAARVLHGLSFDRDARTLLLRRGVRGLAESIVEHGLPDADTASAEAVASIATRLLARLADGRGSNSRGATPRSAALGAPRSGGLR